MKKQKIIELREVQHIRNELSILRQINHNFIVKFYSSFQDTNKVYLVLDFI